MSTPRAHALRPIVQPPDDPFDRAARLFSFRVLTTAPAVPSESGRPSPPLPAEGSARPLVVTQRKSRRRRTWFHGITTASFSASVMGMVALLTVGMTTPAEALPHDHPVAAKIVAGDAAGTTAPKVQMYVTPSDTVSVDVSRTENYSVASLVVMAGTEGISNLSSSVFANDQNCAIQWPYAVGVPMTYGFGMRDGRMHEGTDFVPGAGAHIQAIADGLVRISTDSGGPYGVTIVIDHVVNGEQISTRYAHMEYDSRQVQVGDAVTVGEYIGRTGDTGRSFGAHLHFEVLENGATAIDPLPWLRQHANC